MSRSAGTAAALAVLAWGLSGAGGARAAGVKGSGALEPGLVGRSDIVFFTDFESRNWASDWGFRGDDRTDTVAEDPDRQFKPLMGKALRIRVDRGDHYGTSISFDFKRRTGSEPEEIYWRYYLRFGEDWKPEGAGKLPGFGGTYGRAGWGGRPVRGRLGWSARGLLMGQKGGKTPIGYYCYHADMRGKYGGHWVWEKDRLGHLENNRWYCVEQYCRMNTLPEGGGEGNRDGILRGWIDGKLAFEKTDLRMRHVPELKIEKIWVNAYYGGSWTAKQDMHVFMDNVVIARKYIGPAVYKRPESKEKRESKVVVFRPKEKADPLKSFAEALAPVREKAKASDYAGALAQCEKVLDGGDGGAEGDGRQALSAYASGLKAAAELKKLIIAGAAKKKPTVYVDFAGRPMRMKLTAADQSGATFQMRGTGMPLKWRQISPNRFYGIAAKFVPDTPGGHLLLGQYCAAMGLAEAARAELDKAGAKADLRTKADAARLLAR